MTVVVTQSSWSPRRAPSLLRAIARNSLYRNSFLLIANNALLGACGMVFWILASRWFSATDIGSTAAIIAATTLVSTAVGLGLPNVVLRYLAESTAPKQLVHVSCLLVASLGALAAAAWVFTPGLASVALDGLGSRWTALALVAIAVVFPAMNSIVEAAIVARRETQDVVKKNLFGSIVKLVVLPSALIFGAAGLLLAYLVSSIGAVGLALWLLQRRWNTEETAPISWRYAARTGVRELAPRVSFALGNHVGVLVAIVPTSLLPAIVLWRSGARSAAYTAIPMMIVAILNVIPSVTAQSLFAEIAADGSTPWRMARGALRAIYCVMVPAIVILIVGAPFVLSIFGREYTRAGTSALRWMAMAGIFASFNYVADAVLIARSRVAAYTLLNIAGTVCAFGFPIVGLVTGFTTHSTHGAPTSLTGFGVGWFLGQAGYAVSATLALRHCASDLVVTGGARGLVGGDDESESHQPLEELVCTTSH